MGSRKDPQSTASSLSLSEMQSPFACAYARSLPEVVPSGPCESGESGGGGGSRPPHSSSSLSPLTGTCLAAEARHY